MFLVKKKREFTCLYIYIRLFTRLLVRVRLFTFLYDNIWSFTCLYYNIREFTCLLYRIRKKSLAGLESPTSGRIKQPAISFISFFAHPPVDNRSLPSAGSGLYSTAKDTVVGEVEIFFR